MSVGETARLVRVVTEDDVRDFARLSGDRNPIHLDAAYAAGTTFRRPIAHGALLAGLISSVLGTELPGPGAIYLSQTLRFRAPVFYGDEVRSQVEVTAIRQDKPVVTLRTTCVNQEGVVVLEGEALLLCPWLLAAPEGAAGHRADPGEKS